MTDAPAPPATATEARAVLDARMADKDWGERVSNGDPNAKQELRDLAAKIAAGGDDTVAVAMNGKLPDMPTSDQRIMAHTAALFRELGIRDEVTSEFLRGKQVSPQEYEMVANWKKEHMGNAEWVQKYLSGDVEARQKMTIANSVLVNGVKSEKAA
jgi:radical SAM superfamily enzyme YgiQ (UPF0313 family)